MNDLIVKREDGWLVDPQAVSIIVEYSKTLKVIETQLEKIKTALQEEMKEKNIIDLEADTGDVTVSLKYILPTDTETFDKKQFRADHPDMYDKYISMKKKAGYLRITVK